MKVRRKGCALDTSMHCVSHRLQLTKVELLRIINLEDTCDSSCGIHICDTIDYIHSA